MMDILDNMSSLPEWDDDRFNAQEEEDDGESWKKQALRESSKALYEQWRQVMTGINALLASDEADRQEVDEFWTEQKRMLLGDAYQIAVKILTCGRAGMYVIQMENAAIVRKNALLIYGQLLSFAFEEKIEMPHAEAVMADIDVFRQLFKAWIATFSKDEFKDDWGFFV